jgi:G:T/U-mismatch repair DNA glycosylase
MCPLTDMVDELRAEERGYVPDMDPLDGGVVARLLFLMEKPGPMTAPREAGKQGSGFISRDNDDQTAAAIFGFMNASRIPRDQTLLWNAIPWWNGTIRITPQEWRDGLSRLEALTALLPDLRGVVLVGKKAERARAFLTERGLSVWASAHPSPRNRAAYPARWNAIPEIWSEAARSIL